MRLCPTVLALLCAGSVMAEEQPRLAAAVTKSVRPVMRPLEVTQEATLTTIQATTPEAFSVWLADFQIRARAAGVSPAVLDQALSNVQPDPVVIRRDRNQSEFSKTIWEYLDTAVSQARVDNGRKAVERHRATLDRIEVRYGVDKEIVAAIWGLESAYGAFRGNDSTIRSLATLAHDARRSDFFEDQLLAALQIIDAGQVSVSGMRGSWAGAMGHTQFMPTSYQQYAVDFTGDGRRDIWSDDPTDALASAASYLREHGWISGQPWGVEVRLPQGFDYVLARRENTRMPSEWAELGVVDVAGRAVPDHGAASILLPAGHQGAAFMIFDNFAVLERYNTADAYVIGVGHLADRISGDAPLSGDWPRSHRGLSFAERKEVQERLTQAGFDTQKIDGKIGPLTINAARAYQLAQGLVPDGYVSLRLLERLR